MESFWHGYWSVTFSPTFPSLIAVTRHKATSHENSSATSQRKMRTTVQKENHFAITVYNERVRDMPITRRKHSVEGVHRRNSVPGPLVENYLYIGKSQRDKGARALAGTPDYLRSQRARYKVEALFAELKQQIKLRRVRLLPPVMECAAAVPPRGHGTKSEEVGTPPGSKAVDRSSARSERFRNQRFATI